MSAKIVILLPAGGVAFNQLKDGSIRCHINPQNAEPFRKNVLRLADEINRYLISHLESQKTVEVVQHVLPKSRIQVLEDEIARLKAQPIAIEDLGGLVEGPKPKTIIVGGFEPDDGELPRPATL